MFYCAECDCKKLIAWIDEQDEWSDVVAFIYHWKQAGFTVVRTDERTLHKRKGGCCCHAEHRDRAVNMVQGGLF